MENRARPTVPEELLSSLSSSQLEDTIDNVIKRENDTSLLFKLEDLQPSLHSFILNMRGLRRAFELPPKSNLAPYTMGNAIMEGVIRKNYEARGEQFPTLPRSITETYFQDLTGGEDTHHETQTIKESNGLFRSSRRVLMPQELLKDIASFNTRGEEAHALNILLDNIHERSNYYVSDMLSEQKGLLNALKYKIPSSRILKPRRKNDPRFTEFCYGALDIYMPFKIFEQSKQFERMYKMKVK